MSASKENTIFTQFSLSSESISFEDSALISGIIEDLTNSRISMQKENSELNLEIELINEDRQRLRRQNELLKEKLEKSQIKNLHIELLSKVATRALEKTYKYVEKEKSFNSNESWPVKAVEKSSMCFENNKRVSPIVKRYLVSRTASSTSPLIIYRNTSKITTFRTIINK